MNWPAIIAIALDVLLGVAVELLRRRGKTAGGVADVLIRTIEADGGRELKRMASSEAARVGLTDQLHSRVIAANFPPDRVSPQDRGRPSFAS